MLQIITNYIVNEQELAKYEETNHKDAFEYLPMAKQKTYMELADGEPVNFLAIKITANNGEEAETELLANNVSANMKVCSVLGKTFMKYKDEFEVVSISYKPTKLKSDGILLHALILTNDGEPLLEYLNRKIIYDIKQSLRIQLDYDDKEFAEEYLEDSMEESDNNVVNNLMGNNDLKKEDSQDDIEDNIQTDIYDEKDNVSTELSDSISDRSRESSRELSASAYLEQNNTEEHKDKIIQKESVRENSFHSNTSIQQLPDDSRNHSEDRNIEPIRQINPFNHLSAQTFRLFQNALMKNNADSISPTKENTQTKQRDNDNTDNSNNGGKPNTFKKDLVSENTQKGKDKHSVNNENNPKNTDDEQDGKGSLKFIAGIYKNIKDKSDEAIRKQADFYNEDSDIPFLNRLSEYIPQNDISILEEKDPIYVLHDKDYDVRTTASPKKIKTCFERVISYFMESERVNMIRTLQGEKEIKSFMEDIKIYVDKNLNLPEEDKDMFMNKCYRAFFSYYVLTPAIDNPDISDIRVLSPDNINVKVKGSHYTAKGISFLNEADYNRFIETLLIRNKVKTNSPIIIFTDKDYDKDYILRFNLCLSNINSTEMPYLHIRKVPKKKTTVSDLIKAGMMDEKIAAYILDKIISAKGITFSGPSASGKTTAMNAFIDYIPKEKSILCIQESEELFSIVHPNAYFQHMLKDARGNTVIGLSELGQNGLLCDSGYFIIGECKGAEVRDLLRASNTGHKCWCSVHAQNSKETIPRLADYVKYGSDYSLAEATRMLKDLEVIIYIENFKVTEISEIAGYDEDKKEIIYNTIYKRNIEKEN